MSEAAATKNETSHPRLQDLPLTERLAAFCIATRAEDLPAAALESAQQLILDTIGVALLASSHKIGRLITAQAKELGAHAQTASVLFCARSSKLFAPPDHPLPTRLATRG